MTLRPAPQAKTRGTSSPGLGGESELRVRSYGFFHRINESMVLGMHPVFAYPRRSRVAPSSTSAVAPDAAVSAAPGTDSRL